MNEEKTSNLLKLSFKAILRYKAIFNNTLKLNSVYRLLFHILVMFLKIGFYIVVLLFAVGITVVLVAYGNRTLGGTVPKKVPNVQTLKSGFGTDDQVYVLTNFFFLFFFFKF